jgi:NitT/TauT family transport system ATP-binding protein
VFLSDRIAVMSPRPGHLTAVVPIDFPRPRTLETISSPDFARYMAAVRRHLHGGTEVVE